MEDHDDRYLLNLLQSSHEKDGSKLMIKPETNNRYVYNSWVETFQNTEFEPISRPLARAGFFVKDDGAIMCIYCQLKLPINPRDVQVGDDVVNLLKLQHICWYAVFMSNSRPKQYLGYDSLRYESERLETFIDWPIRSVSPFDLAANGLFYLRQGDHCACIFCGGIIGHWKKHHRPAEEHARHYPNCPFILGDKPVGNVPMKHCMLLRNLTRQNVYAAPPPRLELDYNYQENAYYIPPRLSNNKEEEEESRAMGVILHDIRKAIGQTLFVDIVKPQYQQRSVQSRENAISNFHGRKKTFGQRSIPNPNDFSKAGLYWLGISDHMACFCCQVLLRNWERDDDPLGEHARASPKCPFLLRKLGLNALQSYKSRWTQYPSYLGYGVINHRDTMCVLPTLMTSDVIRSVLETHKYDDVFKTLYYKIRRTGVPFFSVTSFLDEFNYHFIITKMDDKQDDNIIDIFQLPAPTYHTLPCQGCSYCTFSQKYGIVDNKQEQQRRNERKQDPQQDECIICYTKPIDSIFLPCQHTITCQSCAKKCKTRCPMCRSLNTTIITLKKEENLQTCVSLPCAHVSETLASSSSSSSSNCSSTVCYICQTITRKKIIVKNKEDDDDDDDDDADDHDDQRLCKVCKERKVNTIFLPCLHKVTCSECSRYASICPSRYCQTRIRYKIKPIYP